MSKELLPNVSRGKGTPPGTVDKMVEGERDNLSRLDPSAKVRINMEITHGKKMEMWAYAKERGLSLTELLTKAFDEYKSRNT